LYGKWERIGLETAVVYFKGCVSLEAQRERQDQIRISKFILFFSNNGYEIEVLIPYM
jgi:hypothetical protein